DGVSVLDLATYLAAPLCATLLGEFGYRTRDARWIAIACTNDRMFVRLLQAMGRPDLAGDPRMTTTAARLEHRALVDELVAAWVAERDAANALAALEA